jgi:hypothetical protein
MKEMRAKGLDPRPELPLLGYSVVATMEAARSIRSTTCRWRSTYNSFGSMRPCSLASTIQSKIGSLEQMLGGLTLDEFGRCRKLG